MSKLKLKWKVEIEVDDQMSLKTLEAAMPSALSPAGRVQRHMCACQYLWRETR